MEETTRGAGFVSPKTVALYGVLTALTAAITFVTFVPFAPTKGYFNMGDSMVFFSAFAFGWRAGAICGGVGSAAADVLLGSGYFAPYTLVAKGLRNATKLHLAAENLRRADGAEAAWWFGLMTNSKGKRAVRALRILVEAVK